jgi:DNA polymerase-3 subunit alpha
LEALARQTRLQMTVRVPDERAAERLAAELAASRNGNGAVRIIVPLSNGGEATMLLGRDFSLDRELATRIERIVGEGGVDLSAQEAPRLALVG